MKIALISSPYVSVPPKKYGGTEQVVYYLIKGLMEAGHEPILLAPGDSQVDCELIPICDSYVNFAKKSEDRNQIERMVREAEEKTAQILTELAPKVDIIHSHGFDLKDFQYFPNLTTLHNSIDFTNMDYFEDRKDLFYVSISKNQQLTLPELQYMGVAYNGLSPDDFPLITEPEDYLCFIGRFDVDKNPHLAIQIALKLEMKLKIAGKLDYKGDGYFEQEIQPHLDNPLIEYLGELDFKRKIELIGKAKCNLHPTGFREPFGLTVLESAYCGTPTLAIKRGSMPELIEEGRTGLLVEDFIEGYHHIEECFGMDREYIAQRARFLFNYKTMAKQYVYAYEKVIEATKQKQDQKDVYELLIDTKKQIEKLWQTKQS
jgi:glycosyltransferase involved in cell wall biosynthesis